LGSAEPGTEETAHFRIHSTPGSFAAANVVEIGGRLERARDAIRQVLDLDIQDKIDVYFSELTVQYEGYRLAAGGYARVDRLQIHDVYRPDSPGENLERLLLTIVLGRAWHIESPPDVLVDGLLFNLMQRLGSDATLDEVAERLSEAKAQGTLPSLTALLGGPTSGTRAVYYPAAASLVDFVLRARGVGGLKDLADWSAAGDARSAELARLEKEWRKTIRIGSAGGVFRFFQLIGPFLRQHKLKAGEVVLYIVLSSGFLVVMQLVPGWLVDVLQGQPTHILTATVTSPWPLIVGLAIAFAAISVISQRQAYTTAYVTASVQKEMRLQVFAVIQRLDPGYFQTMPTGDVISRMSSDMSIVRSAMTGPMTQTVQGVVTIVLAAGIALHTNWQMALETMAFMPVFFLISFILGPRAARSTKVLQQRLARATAALQENLGAQPVVKAFGLQEYMVAKYAGSLNDVFQATLRQNFLMGVYGLAVGNAATGINIFILALGSWLVIRGQMTAGILIQFLGLMNQIISPVRTFAAMMQALQQAAVSMDRVNDLLKAEPSIKDLPESRPIQPLTRAVEFDNVVFGYGDDEPAIRGVSLAIPGGARVAFVGRSGSGKSTMLSLLMRFYEPTGGRILVDGVDIRSATLESMRAQLGVVFQENVLFNTSLRENIRLGNLTANDDDVAQAARMAEIHEFIMGLPDQYDTVAGERGTRLSGGQRQRIAIARAIIRKPHILLLDEATSALDPVAEAAINETLERVGQGCTTIAVTHRLASARTADRIYVMDRGTVVEEGTHAELLQSGGLYAQMWEEQGGGMAEMAALPEGVESSFLRRVPMLSQLDSETLGFVARHLMREEAGAGEMIVTYGDSADRLYIIQKGQVEVLDPDPATGNRPLAVLGEGDHFGEIALLHDTARSASVRTRLPVTLYSLGRDDFNRLIMTVPALRDALEATVRGRARAGEVRRAQTLVRPADAMRPT